MLIAPHYPDKNNRYNKGNTPNMSFSFGFTSTDFSDDEIDGDSQFTNSGSAKYFPASHSSNALDAPHLLAQNVVQPKVEELKSILQSLENVRLSFEEFKTPQGLVLYRRELFDVKHQLMSEVDDSNSTDASVELGILIGETSEDLRKNVYEGGLKSWECSIDLVDTLSDNTSLLDDFDCILELGCGTSLPTEYIFACYLQGNLDSGLRMILSDYNKSVLRLVTVPNLIITWAKSVLTDEHWVHLQQSNDTSIPVKDDELLLTPQLLEAFYKDIQARNISIILISGSWGRLFSHLVSLEMTASKGILLLTAETIYQPDNLPVVAETVLNVILSKTSTKVKALVAAKDIYFGVGGSIIEFEKYLSEAIRSKSLPVSFHTYKVNAGLKRSIISIE